MASKYGLGYNKRKTSEQFAAEIKEINPNIDLIGTYVNAKEKTSFRCNVCNYSWESTPSNLLKRSVKCPNCSNGMRYTDKSFKEKVYGVNDSITILGNFSRVTDRILVRCNICGKEWSPVASKLLLGQACPECSRKRGAKKKILSQREFERLLEDKNPNVELNSDFHGMTKRISVKCKICGYEWNSIADNIIRGKGCRKCAYEKIANAKKISTDDFASRLAYVNSSIIPIGVFSGTQERIKVHCSVCGYEWNPIANQILRGFGCPRCAKTQTSFMEQFVLLSLELNNANINIISRDKLAIGKELDIYVPSKKFAIEIGSWYWHKDRYDSDNEKRSLCNAKGIRLITIYDCCPEKITQKDTLCYDYNLALEQGRKTLKMIVKKIYDEWGISCTIKEEEWKTIEERARERCKIITTEEFINKISSINPTITIIGNYESNNTPIKCKCKLCGHEWNARPYHLYEGTGCPKCAGRVRTNDEFLEMASASKNPNVIIIGQYENSQKRIKCKCKKCSHEWLSLPWHIIEGKGCSMCNGGKAKPVMCITTGEKYNSIREASDATGISSSAISRCCNGKIKNVLGREFRFLTR